MFIKLVSSLCEVVAVICLSVVISSCAVDYPRPESIILQQPKPGESLVYFLRAPHDSGSLAIEVNGKRVAKLPPGTYVVLSLNPGNYRFVTTSGGLFSNEEIARPLDISLEENERKFFHVSGVGEKRLTLTGLMRIKGGGVVPLLGNESVISNREWKECTELDARGFITISRRIDQE